MLVLSRKTDEKIMIGNDISIVVLETKGNRVRIGIEAPREMRVLRGELFVEQTEFEVETESESARDARSRFQKEPRFQKEHSEANRNDSATNESNKNESPVSLQVFDKLSEPVIEEAPTQIVSSISASNDTTSDSFPSTEISFTPLQRNASRLSGRNFETPSRKQKQKRTTNSENRLLQILEESRQERILPIRNDS